MLDGLTSLLKRKVDAALKTTAFGFVAMVAGLVAFAFFCAAAFVWVQRDYGTIAACLTLGGAFLLIAVIAVVAIVLLRRRRAREIRRQAASFANPATLLAALKLSRALGGRQSALLALVGAFVAGLVLSQTPPKRDD